MKIAHMNKISGKETLDQLLKKYMGSPHRGTGLPPAAEGEKQMKQNNTYQNNTSKYKKQDQINL